MNENAKTGIYVAVAAVFGLTAWLTLPGSADVSVTKDKVGKPLFAKFDDASKAAALEISWYDETFGQTKSFKVSKVGGQWVVPSHDNYPADAEQQLQEAAQALFGLTCLDLASEVSGDHELYGVVEPPKETGGSTKKGVGKLIVLQDDKGDDLVRMVVGKEVDKTPGQRFVRIAETGEVTPHVYVTEIDLAKLPTEFDKWIERDLLKLNPNDVAQLTLKDYSIVPVRRQSGQVSNSVQLKMDSTISWDTLEGAWSLDKFQLYDESNRPHDATMAEGEELAKTRLDDLKNALDDLKIEGVDRKPEGLAGDLTLDEKLLTDDKLISSLQEHGYFIGGPDEQNPEIFSRNGEVNVDCKDGVRYVLRFGDVAGVQEGTEIDKLNRYLLVSTQLAENMLPKPVLEPEPAGPEPAIPATPPETPPTEAPTGASGGGCQEEEAKENDGETKAAAPPAETKTKAKSAPAAKTKSKAKGAKSEGAKGDDGKAKSDPVLDPAQVRREQIKRENDRKLKEWEDKRKKAQGRVEELNARFAGWYYVISEDTYKKIHLGRSDIIQEGASAKETGFGIDAFRKLESEGLKKSTPSAAPSSPGLPNLGAGFPGAP